MNLINFNSFTTKLKISLHPPGEGMNWPPHRNINKTQNFPGAYEYFSKQICFPKVGIAVLLTFLANQACIRKCSSNIFARNISSKYFRQKMFVEYCYE